MNKTLRALTVTAALLGGGLPGFAQEEGDPARSPVRRNVAIFVYPGVELLDFAGPGEVFAAAGNAFRVYTVAEEKRPLESMGFLEVVPEFTLEDCPAPDIVVVPGGSIPMRSEHLQSWLREVSRESEVVMSVCNGALLLGAAGLLDGLEVTTHHGSFMRLTALVPKARVYTNRRFVDNGAIITTAGISAGIDGSLHLVARLLGEDVAWRTARYMEYDWRPEEIAAEHALAGTTADEEGLELLAAIREQGLEALVATQKKRTAGMDPAERMREERRINEIGYMLLGTDRPEPAVEVFRLNVAAHPASANARDSLAEGYEAAGEAELALQLARETLEMLEEDATLGDELRERLREAASLRIQALEDPGSASVAYGCPPCGGGCDEARYAEPGECPEDGCGMALQRVAVSDG